MLREGRQRIRQRRFKQAKVTLESLVEEHPDFGPAQGWLGVVEARLGRHRRATALLAPLVDAGAATPEMLNAYATSLCRSRRWNRLAAFLDAHGERLDPRWVHPGGGRPLDEGFAAARQLLAPERMPDVGVVYHLPFCAGTSTNLGLRMMYGGALKVVGRKLGQHDLRRLGHIGPTESGGQRVVRLHHPYPLDTSAVDATWLTTLRDPAARFMSGYRKRLQPNLLATLDFRGEPSIEATIAHAERWRLHDLMARELAILHPELRGSHPLSSRRKTRTVRFEEQLDYVWMTGDLPPERLHQLANEVLEQQFQVVGVVEHFDASYLAFGAALGLRSMPDPQRAGRSDPIAEIPTAEQVRRIEGLHEVDSALYRSWRARFDDRFGPVLAALASRPVDVQR